MAKRGLWANIHAKKKRIAAGSGEKMRAKGDKGAPTSKAMKNSGKKKKKKYPVPPTEKVHVFYFSQQSLPPSGGFFMRH